jgi:hypothetical protein
VEIAIHLFPGGNPRYIALIRDLLVLGWIFSMS